MSKDNESLKIAMLGHKYVPSREGGVEVVVENLAAEMVKKGHSLTLFNRKRKNYQPMTEYKGCKLETVYTVDKKSLDAVIYAYFATKKVKKAAKKGEFDIVHFHAEGPCLFLGKFPKKSKRNYKLVITVHGLDWQRGKWGGFATKVLKKAENKIVKYADEIIVLSENVKNYFKETYNRDTVFIPNGVSKPEITPAEEITKNWGLTKNSYVLFLARIVPEKGLHYLVDAWKRAVKETGTDKKLVIAGASSHSDEYFEGIASKCAGDDSIIMTGFVQGQVLSELYSNSYLFVLPSDIEGMPMSLLEALTYGNVCLVSDIPENTSVINSSCLTFKKGDVEELTQKLEFALKNDVGGGSTAKLPDWEEIAERTLELYKRL
ncbi:MAG: glycosyltransferase family 4 protein [Muribaculaceae bacterium]|nr:glycosyltransferase family 4 protein [Muribaculaceae bacterium]